MSHRIPLRFHLLLLITALVTLLTSSAAGVAAPAHTGQTSHGSAETGRHSATTPRQPASAAPTSSASTWVTRSGSQLLLGGKPWRFTGVNMYWLGLDENVTDSGGPTYPAHTAVDNGFAAAQSLHAQLVRSISLGVSVGSPRSLEPSLGTFNDAAFASIDYAVADARKYGIRLMIPLTDQWHYYHGGKHTFTNWLGYPDAAGQNCVSDSGQRAREAEFYTDPKVINAFHAYVAHVLNHVNPLTGLRLGADPTIAIWETGNELWDAPPTWTEQTAAYIKTLAPNALVADGSAATGKAMSETAYAAAHVDIIDAHFYPTAISTMTTDAQYIASHGKVYLVGEYPLTTLPDASWLTALAQNRNVAGGLAWSLFPWLTSTQSETHDDGYTFHYPGATSTEQSADSRQLAYANQVAATN